MTIEFVSLVMLVWEMRAILLIELRYCRDWSELVSTPVEDLISRMSLEDIIRLRHHSVMAWLALCLMTMGRLFR